MASLDRRLEIPYFEGVNRLVASNIAKKTELMHAENVRSVSIGTVERRAGSTRVGNDILPSGNYGLFYFGVSSNKKLYRISLVGGSINIYYLNSSSVWTSLTGAGAGLSSGYFDYAIAEGNLFLVNQNNDSRYIKSDGTTVVTSTDSTGHLYNCPRANNINYYKGKLYVADFVRSGVRYKTSVLRSSPSMGIVSLVNEDVANPLTNTTIAITDNKYIYTAAPGNTLEVYRGFTKIATLTVASVQENTITLSAPAVYEVGQSEILAADELWAAGTFNGAKQIRWVANPTTGGVNVKDYDTFKISGPDDEEIKMMVNVGNIMLIGNNNSLSVWNDYVLQSLDAKIGCVSSKGYVKNSGSLFFIHYSGIYETQGDTPKRISDKVQMYIFGATKQGLENASAGEKNTSVFFAIGDVTLYNADGSVDKVVRRVVLEYNMVQENWFVHTGINSIEFASWIEDTDPSRCTYVGINGPNNDDLNVLEFLSGLSDNGREIPFRIDSPNLMLGQTFEKIVNPLEVIIESERGTGLKCFVSLDYGQWYEIEGESVKGAVILKVTGKDEDKGKPPRCRNIRYSLRDNSKRIYKISKLAIRYILSNEEEPIKPDYDG